MTTPPPDLDWPPEEIELAERLGVERQVGEVGHEGTPRGK